MKVLLVLLVVSTASVAIGAEPQVVFRDDFEAASDARPPRGWAMWGAEPFKVPANYTRDLTQPHRGQACFRIHHPANTRGYVVSSPDRALHPKPAMLYRVSFWARADRPGKAMFQWTAYRTINPFVDARSPGSFSFEPDSGWREFTFSVREGLDFFANQSPFLMLTFMAATEPKAERTLWLDDIQVSEQPDPDPAGLLDDSSIPHEALQHRLQPGERLEFAVDAARRLRRATTDVGGVSFHRVCGWTGQPYNKKGGYTLVPELETAIREMRLPMTRFYAVGDEPFGVESALDKVAEICRRVGVAPEHCVLEFEEQGAATKLAPETWARGVSYAQRQGYPFHYWEIANEPYSSLWGHGGAFPTPEIFIEHFRSVSRAIRQVDAEARIGMDINGEQVRWGNYLLKKLAGDYDFVAPHYYCGADVRKLPFEAITLTENYRILDRALRLNALLRAYNVGREVFQYDTEWGMICGTAAGDVADREDRNANILGTVHRAVRLIYYAREGILRGASGWQMFSRLGLQGFGILSQDAPTQRFLLYWLYYYFNRHLGAWVLGLEGTTPFYSPPQKADREQYNGPLAPVLATASEDGSQIYLVIANGSWTRPLPCRAHLLNFRLGRATGVVLTHDDLDGKPLLNRKADAVSELPMLTEGANLQCTIPPHAVIFLTLTMAER